MSDVLVAYVPLSQALVASWREFPRYISSRLTSGRYSIMLRGSHLLDSARWEIWGGEGVVSGLVLELEWA